MKTNSDIIEASEHYLTFKGTALDAYHFVREIRDQYEAGGMDMSNVFIDLLYNIEVELQNYGYLDEDFNPTEKVTQP